MKTLNDVKAIRAEFINRNKSDFEETKLGNKDKEFLVMLNECVLYLEYNIDPAFVQADLEKQETLLKKAYEQFDQYKSELAYSGIKNVKAKFNEEFNISKIKKSIKTLKFLLS